MSRSRSVPDATGIRGEFAALNEFKAVHLYRGVSVYKVRGSQYWYVRVWNKDTKRYVVKSTGETSLIQARAVAQDYALSLLKAEQQVEREFTFRYFALKCLTKSASLADGR